VDPLDEMPFLSHLEHLAFERSAEIEALSCKIACQEAAITGFRARHDRHDNRHQEWAQKSRSVSEPVFCPGSRRPVLLPVVQRRSDGGSGNAVKSETGREA